MISEALHAAVDKVLEVRLRDPKQRQFAVDTLMNRFQQVRKKPVQNLPERLDRLRERLTALVENVKLGFVGEKLVVKVAGSSDALMNELRRGSDWHDPWDRVDEILLAAILVDPEK